MINARVNANSNLHAKININSNVNSHGYGNSDSNSVNNNNVNGKTLATTKIKNSGISDSNNKMASPFFRGGRGRLKVQGCT